MAPSPGSSSNPFRGRHSRRALCSACVAALFFISAALAGADPLILRAQQSEKASRPDEASRLYASWLDMHAGASGSAAVFAAYFRVEQDAPRLLAVCEKFLANAKGLAGASEQLVRIARLMELAGRSLQARDAYLSAYAEGAPDWCLVSAFLLSLEMNDADSLQASLAQLEGKGGAATELLKALWEIRYGDAARARTALAKIADASGDPALALKALWVLSTAAAAQSGAAARDARATLARRFPGAPEAAMVGSPEKAVVIFPSPDPFADAPAAPTASPAASNGATAAPAVTPAAPPETTASPAPKAVIAVQAGSFQVKENADDLVGELVKGGFHPAVREETINGKVHYRVLAGAGLWQAEARNVLARLEQAGFTGFLVTEK